MIFSGFRLFFVFVLVNVKDKVNVDRYPQLQ